MSVRHISSKTVLDVCSGLGGFSEAFLRNGYPVSRLDNDIRFKNVPNMVMGDVFKVRPSTITTFDVVLASPPCETFSVGSIKTHWKGGWQMYEPKTPAAEYAITLVQHLFHLMKYTEAGVMENPRGILRKIAPRPPDVTVWYCRFGDDRAKPTDLWLFGDAQAWPIPWEKYICENGNLDHAAAPRGSKRGGSQGRNTIQSSKVPYKLSYRLMRGMERFGRAEE